MVLPNVLNIAAKIFAQLLLVHRWFAKRNICRGGGGGPTSIIYRCQFCTFCLCICSNIVLLLSFSFVFVFQFFMFFCCIYLAFLWIVFSYICLYLCPFIFVYLLSTINLHLCEKHSSNCTKDYSGKGVWPKTILLCLWQRHCFQAFFQGGDKDHHHLR